MKVEKKKWKEQREREKNRFAVYLFLCKSTNSAGAELCYQEGQQIKVGCPERTGCLADCLKCCKTEFWSTTEPLKVLEP